jgi:hypothetical protein
MKKIQSLEKVFFASRVIRAIKNNIGFESQAASQEKSQTGISIDYPHYAFPRGVMNATLEAEKQKAMAIMDYKRRSLVQ